MLCETSLTPKGRVGHAFLFLLEQECHGWGSACHLGPCDDLGNENHTRQNYKMRAKVSDIAVEYLQLSEHGREINVPV